MQNVGTATGDTCGRNGCAGILEKEDHEELQGCTCFRNPPCSYCMLPVVCPLCSWSEEAEEDGTWAEATWAEATEITTEEQLELEKSAAREILNMESKIKRQKIQIETLEKSLSNVKASPDYKELLELANHTIGTLTRERNEAQEAAADCSKTYKYMSDDFYQLKVYIEGYKAELRRAYDHIEDLCNLEQHMTEDMTTTRKAIEDKDETIMVLRALTANQKNQIEGLRGDVKEQIQHLNDRADRIVALELAVEKQKEMIDNKDQYVGQLEFMVEQAEASAGNYKIGKERMADRHQAEIKGILKAIKALK